MLHERFELQRRYRHIAGLFQGLIAYAPVGLELHVGVDADFEVPLDQELKTPIRHLQHAQNRGDCPDPIEVVGLWFFDGSLALRGQHQLAVGTEGALDGPYGGLTPYGQWHDHVGKDHNVPHR
jgi:hypothetical protein